MSAHRPLRPLLIFGLVLVLPAAAVGYLTLSSARHRTITNRDEAMAAAKKAAHDVVEREAEAIRAIMKREDARPFFHWQDRIMPADLYAANGVAFVKSPLVAEAPYDPRILGWFQWQRSRGVVAGPEFYGPPDPAWREGVKTCFAALAQRLGADPDRSALAEARVERVNVRVLAANEEVGQLLEDLEVANRQQRQTAYLENFEKRTRAQSEEGQAEASSPSVPGAPAAPVAPAAQAAQATQPLLDAADTVDVRVSPFAVDFGPHLARRPTLVLWRLVLIPGPAAKDRRDAPSDRWLLQGVALDAGRSFPDRWTPEGTFAYICRGTCSDVPPGPPALGAADGLEQRFGRWGATAGATSWHDVHVPGASVCPEVPIAKRLDPANASRPPTAVARVETRSALDRAWEDSALAVVAVPAEVVSLDAVLEGERARVAWLLGGLAAVVGVGLFVLLRSVRREVALAERKQDFVAAVTHELKTPLAGIRMYADMLKEGWVPDGGSVSEYAGRIGGETQRLSSLVDQILDLAALERGVATFRPMPGDLGSAVRQAVDAAKPAAAEAGVPVAVEIEDGMPVVSFDPALVRPLVGNLLDNAIKYSARSETKDVRVSLRRTKADGHGVSSGLDLVIADRGPGIAKADLGRLFQPFSRGGREETRTARGVGLGLALVKRYADAHKAKVTLDSEVGRGTTVTVRFPA